MKTHKKSLLVGIMVTAFLAAGLLVPKSTHAEIGGPGPRGLKQEAVSVLEAAKTGDPRVDKAINSVIRSISMSLGSNYWVDEYHLNHKRGRRVLDYELRAAGSMAFLIKFWLRRDSTPDQLQAIDAFKQAMPNLVEADRLLAKAALEDAHNTSPPTKPKKQKSYYRALQGADQAYKRALRQAGKNRPVLSIIYFRRAWVSAQRAIKLSPGPAPSPEVCDGKDNDLDGLVDEDFNVGSTCIAGVGACRSEGVFVCSADGSGTVCNAVPGTPTAEVCDGLDNNCDGNVDEGFDADSDGIPVCNDNCPNKYNPDQLDTNGDGIGDACQCLGVNCDDGKPCTADSCSPKFGCINTPGNAGSVCRPAAGDCDSAEVCTGTSADCPADEFRPSTFECRASAGTCDIAETCSGTSDSCPDDGFLPSTQVCRAATGDCDAAEMCSGSSATCPADGFLASTTVCRAANGACDAAETCSGASATCPADGVLASGTTCRSASGPCDIAEVCNGTTATCPADTFAVGNVCREAAGPCDVAEICSGTSAGCPTDEFRPSTTQCRAAAGDCDIPEMCSGTSEECPADEFRPPTFQCRARNGDCDVAETCDGSSPTCPADGFLPSVAVCRAAAGTCDAAEMCSGTSATCPADVLRPSTFECRARAGYCDVAETCSGSSASCPADEFRPSTFQCRASAGDCDIAEMCSGSSATCPADSLIPAGTLCRSSAGDCDVAETCDGSNATCPADGFSPAGTECRAATGPCDTTEACTGSTIDCPADELLPDGASCNDGNPGTYGDICESGICVGIGCHEEICDGLDNNCDGQVDEGCPTCDPPCGVNGTCVAQEVCDCDPGWTGDNYDVFALTCFGTPADNPAVCSGQGTCIAEDRCICEAGFHGSVCQVTGSVTCDGIANHDPNACNGNGICTQEGSCACLPNYEGDFCETEVDPVCGPAPNGLVCSGHGECIEDNVCDCDPQYMGDDCSTRQWNCFGGANVSEETEQSGCSIHGRCTYQDHCECDEGYGGLTCANYQSGSVFCAGLPDNDPNVCSGRGDCLSTNDCTCWPNFHGDNCEYVVECSGYDAFDPLVCNGNGECMQDPLDAAASYCDCSGTGYTGTYCETSTVSTADITFSVDYGAAGGVNCLGGEQVEFQRVTLSVQGESECYSVTLKVPGQPDNIDICTNDGACYEAAVVQTLVEVPLGNYEMVIEGIVDGSACYRSAPVSFTVQEGGDDLGAFVVPAITCEP